MRGIVAVVLLAVAPASAFGYSSVFDDWNTPAFWLDTSVVDVPGVGDATTTGEATGPLIVGNGEAVGMTTVTLGVSPQRSGQFFVRVWVDENSDEWMVTVLVRLTGSNNETPWESLYSGQLFYQDPVGEPSVQLSAPAHGGHLRVAVRGIRGLTGDGGGGSDPPSDGGTDIGSGDVASDVDAKWQALQSSITGLLPSEPSASSGTPSGEFTVQLPDVGGGYSLGQGGSSGGWKDYTIDMVPADETWFDTFRQGVRGLLIVMMGWVFLHKVMGKLSEG